MKKLLSFVFALCLVPAALAVGGPYEEGKHYEVIAEQGTAKPEVKEFFSFYCPHCFAFDPIVKSLEKSLPQGTVFKKYHVDFMGQASQEIQAGLTQAMILAKAKGKGDEVSKAIFEHIHVKHQPFASAADIKAVVVAAGLDATVYDKEINNFVVKSQTKLMQKSQADSSKAKVLDSVPTFIVNGKYKIINRGLDQANTEQDFKALVQHLLNKP